MQLARIEEVQPRTGLSNVALISLETVLLKTAMSKSYIYEEIEAGRFPSPREVTTRSRRWLESEVDEWILKLPKASSQPRPASSPFVAKDK